MASLSAFPFSVKCVVSKRTPIDKDAMTDKENAKDEILAQQLGRCGSVLNHLRLA